MLPTLSPSSEDAVRRFAERIRPEPVLLVSEWADAHRILPSVGAAEPGPWRTSRTPYLRDIMNALSTGSPYDTVVFAKGSQIGATEAGSCWVGYCIHHAPGPILMVQPTLDMVKRISKQRIQPMIDCTPALSERIAPSRARDAGNTLFQKDFPAGTFVMTGANSASGLRSMPARYLFLDEVDAYPGDVEGEGDPIELAVARTGTFRRNRKVFLCSTPTIEGQSRIWSAFEETDQRYYYVPCPECDGYQTIEWSRITWEDGKPETAAMVCQHCGSIIPERHKGWMLARGEWRATTESKNARAIGFHLSSLYSPPGWYSWGDAAKEFMAAKGHATRLQSFVNTKLGQCWEDRSGETVDANALMARCAQWDNVPEEVIIIVAGVDVQGDRLEITVVGFSVIEQARVLHHTRLYGNPSEPDVWANLDAMLLKPYYTADGRQLSIRVCCVDSGGHHTKEVYDFCGPRTGRSVFAIKGRPGSHPIWSTTTKKKRLRYGAHLHLVGVDTAKDGIHSALSVQNPMLPHHIGFSTSIPDDYFQQLTAERRVVSYSKTGYMSRGWRKSPNARNEALDCFVYALAALEAFKSTGRNKLRQLATVAGKTAQAETPVARVDMPSSAPMPPPPSAPAITLAGWARGA